jgi:septal ring factor EnvC (AmiA/AmiB activator)
MRRACSIALLVLCVAPAWAAESSLAARQAEAKKQQASLRERIGEIQKEIDARESSRRDAVSELKASESAISAISRRLADIETEQRDTEGELKRLNARIVDQEHQLTQRQKELGEQLRAQYASGLSPWTALLSGDDPQAIGRDLGYLGYISRAQADAVRAVRRAITELAQLREQSDTHKKALAALADETSQQKAELQEQQAERMKVLERIEALLKEQRGQAERLARNDERLSHLITGLDAAIAKQAEAARLAEERRRAEAARKAEEARLAALERQRTIQREREAAARAEQAARLAQQRAQREQDQAETEKARQQLERARAQVRSAERGPAERERDVAIAAPTTPPVQRADVSPPPLEGLGKNLPRPVQGEVQGKFGAQRPEGGLWRGIVLRSPEGTPVKAVAPGRVVYSNWLNGFGNIIIMDHGAKYLSVYGYNQALLKQVGDTVGTGDAIATVGATGGQVESGLYFEIRHHGTPVNPLLWLRR